MPVANTRKLIPSFFGLADHTTQLSSAKLLEAAPLCRPTRPNTRESTNEKVRQVHPEAEHVNLAPPFHSMPNWSTMAVQHKSIQNADLNAVEEYLPPTLPIHTSHESCVVVQ